MELENIYEIQASSFINDFKIESKHDLFFYTIPAMLKHLSNYLSTIVSKNLFKDSLKKLSAVSISNPYDLLEQKYIHFLDS